MVSQSNKHISWFTLRSKSENILLSKKHQTLFQLNSNRARTLTARWCRIDPPSANLPSCRCSVILGSISEVYQKGTLNMTNLICRGLRDDCSLALFQKSTFADHDTINAFKWNAHQIFLQKFLLFLLALSLLGHRPKFQKLLLQLFRLHYKVSISWWI